MTKRSSMIALGCAVFLMVAPSLSAEDLAPRFTVFTGGTFVKAERDFNVGTNPFRTNYTNAGRFGFRGTMDLTPHWGVEGTYSFGNSTLRVFDMSATPPVQRNFGVRLHELSGDALYSPYNLGDKVRVFAVMGLGLGRFSPSDTAKATASTTDFIDNRATLTSNNSLVINLGGAVEAKINDRFGLRVDLRDHIGGIPRYGASQTVPPPPGQDAYPVSGRIHDIEMSVGFVFYPSAFFPSPH